MKKWNKTFRAASTFRGRITQTGSLGAVLLNVSGGVILLTAALLHGGSSWSSVVFHAILVTILVMVSTVKVMLEADKRASVTSSADNVDLRVVKKLHRTSSNTV